MLKEEDFRRSLYIIVKDCQYDKDKSYEVEISYKPDDPNAEEVKDDDTNYPIRFVVDSKHLKDEITQVSRMSPLLTIQKAGNEPLQFTFDEAKKVNYNGRYNNSEKIKLQSNLAGEDVFNASIFIDYIKPFTNACIGDDVYIAADIKERMSFMTFLDKKPDGNFSVCVKVFTEIKGDRRAIQLN
jgi:hypothetical protein